MKTLKITSILLLLISFIACKKDIRELRSELSKQKELIAQLQNSVATINTDVKSLQAITTAIQNKVSVVSYVPTATGYTLTMSNGTTIDLKNGTNGADAPRMGVKIDTDGQYYWTLADEFLLQNGQKLRVTGNNGVTPLLRVDGATNYWMASYNNGTEWVLVKDHSGNPIVAVGATGQTGPQGPNGVAGFGITETADTIFITYNGSTYTLPKGGSTQTSLLKMVLVTTKAIGSNISLWIDAAPADRSQVWIDLNNDEKQDPGEKINNFGTYEPYQLTVSKTITVYGKVTVLDCGQNQLTALDVSKNTSLESLSCYLNNLTALDVSKNTLLTSLDCGQNQLTALDVSKNTLLTRLNCFNNSLTALDVSKNTALTEFHCTKNQLTALDVSKNTSLKNLGCSDNQLTALDVSKNTSLENLDCRDNQLTALDVSKNLSLTGVSCSFNQINGVEMGKLINGLPTRSAIANAYIVSSSPGEGNARPTSASISSANAKKWKLYIDIFELTP